MVDTFIYFLVQHMQQCTLSMCIFLLYSFLLFLVVFLEELADHATPLWLASGALNQ